MILRTTKESTPQKHEKADFLMASIMLTMNYLFSLPYHLDALKSLPCNTYIHFQIVIKYKKFIFSKRYHKMLLNIVREMCMGRFYIEDFQGFQQMTNECVINLKST